MHATTSLTTACSRRRNLRAWRCTSATGTGRSASRRTGSLVIRPLQDLQGDDRRDARLADRPLPRPGGLRRRRVVTVRPEQVVEIAFDGLQRSTRYPGGLALRFARVVRYRDDKSADEADTIEAVRAQFVGGGP
nr:hypothetical protein [Pimelobacter simplex]